MKNHLKISSTVIALAMLAAFARPASAQQSPIDFKAGIADPVNTVLAWYMARDAGFYAAQGLNVQIINMNGGSKGAEEAAGRTPRCHACRPVADRQRRTCTDADLRLIGTLEQRHPLQPFHCSPA